MWSLIILFGLLIVFLICTKIEDDNNGNLATALIGIFSILIFLGGVITLIVFSARVPTISFDEKQTVNIVALSNGSDLNGEYFLFAGSVNQNQVYYYFKQTDNGGFVQDYITAKNTIIYQDTVDRGYITIIDNHKYVNPEYAKKYKHWVIYSKEYFSEIPTTTEIHVPPNTIAQEFKINLNKN